MPEQPSFPCEMVLFRTNLAKHAQQNQQIACADVAISRQIRGASVDKVSFEKARPAFFGGAIGIIQCRRMHASKHFERIAYAVSVSILQTRALTIVTVNGVIATTGFSSVCVVIAGRLVLAAGDFQLIAHAVFIRIEQAIAFAVKTRISVEASVAAQHIQGSVCIDAVQPIGFAVNRQFTPRQKRPGPTARCLVEKRLFQ